MKQLLLLLIVLSSLPAFAQKSQSLSKEDSLAIIAELKEDIEALFGSKKESFGDINAGVGSGFFRPTSLQQNNVVVSKAVYNLNGSYFHKTGLGIEIRSLFVNDLDHFTMFQSVISPSFTYTKNKNFSAGVSFARYFNGDSLSFTTSPLVNEWQIFGRLKKVLLQPGLTFNYAHGTYIEEVPRQGNTPAMTITEKASDFGILASIRHSFTWLDIFSDVDAIRLTPTLMTVAGTSKYGMNFAIGSVSKNFNRFNVNPNKKPKKKDNGNSTSPTVIEETYATGFQLQSSTFVLGAEYSYKSFYLQPQYLVDLSFISPENKWTKVFNVNIGMTF